MADVSSSSTRRSPAPRAISPLNSALPICDCDVQMLPKDFVLEDVITTEVDFSSLLYESIAAEVQHNKSDEGTAVTLGKYLSPSFRITHISPVQFRK